jgi:hypothetical protein
MNDHVVRDPSAEEAPVRRERRLPEKPLAQARVGLFSITKERSHEFIDYLEPMLAARGVQTQRFAKATHTKPAAEAVIADVVEHCDVVVLALAD